MVLFNNPVAPVWLYLETMPALLFLLILALPLQGFCQMSDFISVRTKSGRPLKTFLRGSPISFQTKAGTPVSGVVRTIRNDTVYLYVYDARKYPTRLGNFFIDTVAIYTIAVHYKDIRNVAITKRGKAGLVRLSRVLLYGGAGYIALNLINGAYLQESIRDKQNLKNLGIAAGVFTTGFIVRQLFKEKRFSRRQRIEYVRLQ